MCIRDRKAELKKYMLFVNNGDAVDYNVQFYNNYHYTLFVPTNEAMDEAVAQGLPTWESITDYYNSCLDEEGNPALTTADSLKLQAQITYLTNFVRYHFADNSVFVDKSNFDATDYVSSSYDNKKGLFVKLNVKRQNGTLSVKDVNDGEWQDIEGRYNVLARDMVVSKNPTGQNSMNGIKITASSFTVIHQIPHTLNHVKLEGGRHDLSLIHI